MFHIDDYAIIDCHYVVHAVPVNPGDPPETDSADALHQYGIGVILHIGTQCCPVLHWYPTQGLRDAAFERLCTLMQTYNVVPQPCEHDDA